MKLSRLLIIVFSILFVSLSFTACEEDDLTPNPVFDPDFNPDSARVSNNISLPSAIDVPSLGKIAIATITLGE
jgi:hypothetical protein